MYVKWNDLAASIKEDFCKPMRLPISAFEDYAARVNLAQLWTNPTRLEYASVSGVRWFAMGVFLYWGFPHFHRESLFWNAEGFYLPRLYRWADWSRGRKDKIYTLTKEDVRPDPSFMEAGMVPVFGAGGYGIGHSYTIGPEQAVAPVLRLRAFDFKK